MTIQKFAKSPILYFLFFYLPFIFFGSDVFAQSNRMSTEINLHHFLGVKNNHTVFSLNKEWDMISYSQDWTAKVNLPILAPDALTKVTFTRSFHIPDSLHAKKLTLWFLGIRGIAEIKLNNITILDRLNLRKLSEFQ